MKIIGITHMAHGEPRAMLVELSDEELAKLCGYDTAYDYRYAGCKPFRIGQTLTVDRLYKLIKRTLDVRNKLKDASQALRIAAGILDEQLPKLEWAERASDET